jgi:hypothetical protein
VGSEVIDAAGVDELADSDFENSSSLSDQLSLSVQSG